MNPIIPIFDGDVGAHAGYGWPTMFDDMPTKRPHFFFLIAGKKYFALKKCESRFVAIVFSPRRHVEFLDRAGSGNNLRYSRRY
jgi:hypothetical protein